MYITQSEIDKLEQRKKIPTRPITEIVTRHCCPSCGRVLTWTYDENITQCDCGQLVRWREE